MTQSPNAPQHNADKDALHNMALRSMPALKLMAIGTFVLSSFCPVSCHLCLHKHPTHHHQLVPTIRTLQQHGWISTRARS